MLTTRRRITLLAAGLLGGLIAPAGAHEHYITVASTTSTEQSGLFAHILPVFERKSGIEVRVVAQGTGQALETARRGDADVVFVHDPASERRFIAAGFGVRRRHVMYNDFVLVGPRSDPARVARLDDAAAALTKIAQTRARFASRGDNSGTHSAELRLWGLAGIEPTRRGGWYRETGSGMGPTLNTASALDAYAVTDRATWLNFRNRGDLRVLVQGDPRLFNQYGVILVNPERHPHVKKEMGLTFIDWLVSPEGQRMIAEHRIGGEQLFVPNASGDTP